VTARLCTADGCDRPLVSNGLCKRHYDRERELSRIDRKTPRRYARARAWKRAATRLVAAHRDEFERFLAEEKAKAFEETERLHELALAAGVRPHDGIARLRPGPVPDDEEPHERLLLDPERCPQCALTHDHGHRCQHCSADLTDWTTGDNDARVQIAKRMRCVNCGKDGTRRAEPCRDALAGRRWSRHDMRLSPTEVAS
jgi:hypothetical protein